MFGNSKNVGFKRSRCFQHKLNKQRLGPIDVRHCSNIGDRFSMKGMMISRWRDFADMVRRDASTLLCSGVAIFVLTGCSDSGVILGNSGAINRGQPDSPVNDVVAQPEAEAEPVPQLSLAELGRLIFVDEKLSSPIGQSCDSCHSEANGFVDPDSDHPSSLGANGGDFGLRNSPTLFYVAQIPGFQHVELTDPVTQLVDDAEFGGFFLDGRSATLEEQAKQPFFNPIEMALPSIQEFATRIQSSDYSEEFQARFGKDIYDNPNQTLDSAASALAAFQRTSRFSPFNSKFDRVKQGQQTFTDAEARGEELFNGRALCSLCHASPDGPEVFSDFLYHNIGTPANATLLSDIGDQSFVDLGLGAITGNVDDNGKLRTPTLRNLSLTAPYMHNGVFGTVREVVEFYNTGTASPENPGSNVFPFMGLLFLSDVDVDDIVAFLNTLNDQ